MTRRNRGLWPAVGLFLSLAAGCDDLTSSATPTLGLYPSEVTLFPFESLQLVVTISPDLAGARISWSSSDPSVAQVSSTGRITARNVGFATISASARQVTGTTTLAVLEPTVCPEPIDVASC